MKTSLSRSASSTAAANHNRSGATAGLFFLVVALVPTTVGAQERQDSLWRDTDSVARPSGGARTLPQRYRSLALDTTGLRALLAQTGREATPGAVENAPVLALPLPDGTYLRFRVVEAPIMAPELGRRFPDLRTYRGFGVEDPLATVRFDLTPKGLHAMARTGAGTVFIDPLAQEGDPQILYMSYYKRDYSSPQGREFECEVERAQRPLGSGLGLRPAVGRVASGSELRTYRVAVAATGEYTTFHGGTKADGMAAIVTAMNRVNQVYETELAVRMVLVANNDDVVYTNGATDPYTNSSGGDMLDQNQTTLDSLIGAANYDVGHVLSTGGGGVASLGVICWDGFHGRGVTGLPAPTGDPFYVDFVAHEMGHQFGANHTFNGTTSSCGGGNRYPATAYEPGSGSTIMAYAGICAAENLQSNSDPYFHGASYDEIIAYVTDTRVDYGGECPVLSATGNDAPSVEAGVNRTVPVSTPFVLTGSATDPNGHSLTYGWEQFDLGSAGPPNTDNGNRPIFRSFAPTSSPSRTLPRLEDVLDGTLSFGESFPTTTRSLNFRLTARDGQSGGGGIDFDSMTVSVVSSAGPFEVTSQTTPVTWVDGDETVTWNVASTDLSPISCSAVDITLSSDGGLTYPTTLASATSNDGSHTFTVPGLTTSTARVRVQCSENVFFDVSNVDFSVNATGGATIFSDGFESGNTSAWTATYVP